MCVGFGESEVTGEKPKRPSAGSPSAAASSGAASVPGRPAERSAAREALSGLAEERLARQVDFLVEADRLKTVLRRTSLTDGSRAENTAEHSWHLTLMAIVLAGRANQEVDLLRVLRMLIVHDIVEIDAGDTFVYDTVGEADKAEREQLAADRLFGLLPHDQNEDLVALWREFELRESPEARFAAALDRISPMLQNFMTEGHSWQQHSITRDRVVARNQHAAQGSRELWEFALSMLDEAVARGWLSEAAAGADPPE